MRSLRIGIDIGGTFTDFFVNDLLTGQIDSFKVSSTPNNPALAVLEGLKRIIENDEFAHEGPEREAIVIVHGSTVATNTLVERKGPPIAFMTTRGFSDILQIGRQNRPVLYDLSPSKPPPLVPSELCFEVNERIDHEGNILNALSLLEVDSLVEKIKNAKIETVAVCFLFSFLHPDHEHIVGKKLRNAGIHTSLSSEIIPEFREYERASTTAVNAYVSPIMDKYLTSLECALPSLLHKNQQKNNCKDGIKLQIMQSNGGRISASRARVEAVRSILSGPAGGLIGCEFIGRMTMNYETEHNHTGLNLITFDMGGTSTDVSLIVDRVKITTDSSVGGCPICIPMLDIHSIGAGGGSIIKFDVGDVLRVGPESAGADPGPACYGNGELPTITDANVVLGRIPPDRFLGGQIKLDINNANKVLARLGKVVQKSAKQIALGAIAIANAHMERALRVISIERGYDPRDFSLISFGGAGGLHASELAHNLGIKHLLVPSYASTLSAFGMLAADVIMDYSQTVMLPGDTSYNELKRIMFPMVERGRHEILREEIRNEDVHVERYIDMRYRGQSYELIVPFTKNMNDEFYKLHTEQYGYAKRHASLEIVNLRVRVIGKVKPPQIKAAKLQDRDPKNGYIEHKDITFSHRRISVPLYQVEALQPGNHIDGPALLVRKDTTILLNPLDIAQMDAFGNIHIEVG